jgi:hypothetical protein
MLQQRNNFEGQMKGHVRNLSCWKNDKALCRQSTRGTKAQVSPGKGSRNPRLGVSTTVHYKYLYVNAYSTCTTKIYKEC